MQLFRRGTEFMLYVRNAPLMTSRVRGSEEQLAELALERIQTKKPPRVLVGGLGMGFTLARVLALVDEGATVDVVELVPEIVDWNREWFGELCEHPLRDPRVTVIVGDVVSTIRQAKATYDVILLDVDNGPEGLTLRSNDRLYNQNGLLAARKSLRPAGVVAVWSADNLPWFTDRMRGCGFAVKERRVRAQRTKGARQMIWTGKRT